MTPDYLLKELIRIPSASGNEKELGNFLVTLLSPFFTVRKIQVANGRFNVFAWFGQPKVFFSTHMDTVVDTTKGLFEDSSLIYGRGSCDAKGSMASMICAALELKSRNIPIGLYFTVGEEDDFCGIKKGLPIQKPSFVIIGEPTQLIAKIGQKGLLGFELKSQGKTAHGATPELGKNAILDLIQKINLLLALQFPSDEILGESIINIGKIKGGTSTNVVPEFATASVEIRTVVSSEIYLDLILSALGDCISVKYVFDPVRLSSFGVRRLKKLFDKLDIEQAFTELYFWPNGIIFGPGNMKFAHTSEEQVKKDELFKAVKMYVKIVEELT